MSMRQSSGDDLNERLVRWFLYCLGGLLLLMLLLAIVWKFRDAMLDGEAQAACRSKGGDVIHSPDEWGRRVDEWRCVATTPGRAP